MSIQEKGQQGASPHRAQDATIVNVAPGEGAPKQHTYNDLSNQVTKLMDQIKTAGDADIAELSKRVAEVEAEVAKKATKVGLTRKLTELSKKLSEDAADAEADAARKGETAESAKKGKKGDGGDADTEDDGEDGIRGPKAPEQAETAARKPLGKGLISNAEMDQEMNGPSSPWFRDILKANALLKTGKATFIS
jgi:hypothetical protein